MGLPHAAARTTASGTQPQSAPSQTSRMSRTSKGIPCVTRPSTVTSAASDLCVNTPSTASSWTAASTAYFSGGAGSCAISAAGDSALRARFFVASALPSTTFRRPSLIPLVRKNNCVRGVRSTSGVSCSGKPSRKSDGTKRTHQPGLVRPVRPARCISEDLAHQCVLNCVRPGWLGSVYTVRWSAKSKTPETSGRVSEDSAIVVARTMWQVFDGGGRNTISLSSSGTWECKAKMRKLILRPSKASASKAASLLGGTTANAGPVVASCSPSITMSRSSSSSGFKGTRLEVAPGADLCIFQYSLLCSLQRSA
mmetsp:Transcript_44432/g.122923  ORF Transcript_44432/g.122923 Transcript_44432/m.122923 type:complete len:310 (+) Transcript_44432:2080-3009(+)